MMRCLLFHEMWPRASLFLLRAAVFIRALPGNHQNIARRTSRPRSDALSASHFLPVCYGCHDAMHARACAEAGITPVVIDKTSIPVGVS